MSGSINAHAPTTVTQTLCSVGFVGFAELGTERQQRPRSAASDPLNEDDMQAHVVDDLEVNGQLNPIVVLGGLVPDGWRRYPSIERTHSSGQAGRKNLPIVSDVLSRCAGIKPEYL